MNKKILITLSIIVGAIYAIGNISMALHLNFPTISTSFGNRFSSVHFTAPGNDFVGSIFRLPSKSIAKTHAFSGYDLECKKQLRGLYFNSQRGKRLRPLDSETLTLLQEQDNFYENSYDNLTITGGLYTTCGIYGEENLITGNVYDIFGMITYVRKGITGYIVAGTQLDFEENKIIKPAFEAKSFQYFDNKVPIGYIYDSDGGIGFVGGFLNDTGHKTLIESLTNEGSINEAFKYQGDTITSYADDRETVISNQSNAMETMRNLIIQGSIGLSKSINESERLSLLGNFQDKTLIYNGGDINSSTLINVAKQNTQTLCQGKKRNPDITEPSNNGAVLCYDYKYEYNKDLTIDLDKEINYTNKTIIIKNGNVILSGGMTGASPALNLFIDKGILYLPDLLTTRQTFNTKGFPANEGDTVINSGLYLKGNFIINGLIVGGTPGNETGFNHKLHFQGKITILNTPLEPTTERVSQINEVLGNGYENFINLQKVFTRTCGFNGIGSDNTTCGTGGIISITPLIILNGNYPSNLLQ